MTDTEFERRMANKEWLTDKDVVDKRTEKLLWISARLWLEDRLTPEQKKLAAINEREWVKKAAYDILNNR